ncbi:lysine--tRNA ligase [archaeon]|jgi:lysyl-tRNA synthetase, class I|nr:lysine--tRNA ligase [archaeon]MBT4669662.1 lysine--tRNA ligase [archaeon]MBT8009881.1 lysine--tRNA ligase [archaeon]
MEKKVLIWPDVVVKKIIAEKGDKKKYVCAAGITPSGTVHIGNFREIMTVELVVRALREAGKEVRFIYSWDDYDVFRKVPKNMPKQEMLEKHLRHPIVDIPDPYDKEDSYARHHEIEVEEDVIRVGIKPEYLYQSKKYRNKEYVEGMIKALQNKDKIKEILDNYRTEALSEDWLPISGYCPDCNTDEVTFSDYDGDSKIKMLCTSCKKEFDTDIKKASYIKLPWRVDWPMRWAHEQVDFEPGGKDHSTHGGSFMTGKEIVKEVYNWTAPTYQRYDFIGIKGAGGKISSSTGNVITLGSCLEIYEPVIVRWLFVGTRPNAEFSISFDTDVIKIYEDFDRVERAYFGKEKIKDLEKQKRIYQLSCVDKPSKKLPFQPSFRHLTNFLQINEMDIEKTIASYPEAKTKADKDRIKLRATCAKNWLENHAPEEFKFTIQNEVSKELKLSKEMKEIFKQLSKDLKEKEWTDKELHNHFYTLVKANEVPTAEFFKAAYQILVNKEKGPQLAHFILIIGKERVAELFDKI